jgi:hypothetical protein
LANVILQAFAQIRPSILFTRELAKTGAHDAILVGRFTDETVYQPMTPIMN